MPIEKELLSKVETIKQFCTILLGHGIIVYTGHKNITFGDFTTERVIRWHIMLQEYRTEIKYIKETDKNAADALSRLLLINSDITVINITREQLA